VQFKNLWHSYKFTEAKDGVLKKIMNIYFCAWVWKCCPLPLYPHLP
jgi:hypothetical protein